MKLHAPNKVSYWIAVVFGLAGIYGELSGDILNQSFFYEHSFTYLFIGFLGLALAPLVNKK